MYDKSVDTTGSVASEAPTSPRPAAQEEQAPPPTYDQSRSAASQRQGPQQGPYHDDPRHRQGQHAVLIPVRFGANPESTRHQGRFWSALAVAVLIYLLLSAAIQTTVEVAKDRARRWDGSRPWGPPVTPKPAEDGRTKQCSTAEDSDTLVPLSEYNVTGDHPSDWAYSTVSTFTLPTTIESLYILTRGDSQSGKVTYVTSDVDSQSIEIKVVAKVTSKTLLPSISLCTLRRGQREQGFGIYTPKHQGGWRDWRERASFDVTIAMPLSKHSILRELTSDLSNYQMNLAGIADYPWDHLKLRTSNGGISSDDKTIRSHNADIVTSNAAIRGSFVSDDRLELVTSNGVLDVTTTLINDEDAFSRSHSTVLIARTTNAAVDVRLHCVRSNSSSLYSDTMKSIEEGGKYSAEVTTNNGHFQMSLLTLPRAASFNLKSETSNSKYDLEIPVATYEGSYEFHTSNSRASIAHHLTSKDDPWNKRREPIHRTGTFSSTTAKGSLGWSDPIASNSIFGQTSNGGVDVRFGQGR